MCLYDKVTIKWFIIQLDKGTIQIRKKFGAKFICGLPGKNRNCNKKFAAAFNRVANARPAVR